MKTKPVDYFFTLKLATCLTVLLLGLAARADYSAIITNSGTLGYTQPIPDYSFAGYALSEKPIPTQFPIKAVLLPSGTDDTAAIQQAIDTVSAMPLNSNGIRGAVYLRKGTYSVSGSLTIKASGVILKGDGNGGDGTIVRHTGTNSVSTVIIGSFSLPSVSQQTTIADPYVSAGTNVINVASAATLSVGQEIQVTRPVTDAWVDAVGMTGTWSGADFTLKWLRTITAINGNELTLNAPVTSAIDTTYGAGKIYSITSDPRLSNIGVEDIVFVSDYDRTVMAGGYYTDENHASTAIVFQAVKDCWVRRVTGFYYWFNFVRVARVGGRVTIEDCAMYDPISLDTAVHHQGTRAYLYCLDGSETLVQRCYTRRGRHPFVTDGIASTTNVFLDSYSQHAHFTNEPHQRWSTAILYDNVYAETMIALSADNSDHGVKCANSMIWNCEVNNLRSFEANIQISNPLNNTGYNWAIGNIFLNSQGYENPPVTNPVIALPAYVEPVTTHVEPRSLFIAQLDERNSAFSGNIMTATQALGNAEFADLVSKYGTVPEFQDPDNVTWLAGWNPTYEAKVNGVQPYRSGSNVLSLWHFDETDLTSPRADSSGTNPLVKTGTATIPVVDGLFGNAVGGFNVGDNNYFATSGYALANPSAQTFEAWVMFPTGSSTLPQDGSKQMIMTRRGSRTPINFYFQSSGSNGYLYLQIKDAQGVSQTVAHNCGTSLQHDIWYHIAYSLEQTGTNVNAKLYLQDKEHGVSNPEPVESVVFSNFTYDTGAYNLRIGEDGNTGSVPLIGIIDEVRYRSIASAEFETFGRSNPAAYSGTGSDLIGLWHLDSPNGTTYPDSGPNGYTLTENNLTSGTLQVISGVCGGAVVGFDTMDNHSLSTVSSVSNPSTQSMEAWVLFDDSAQLPHQGRTQLIFARPSSTDRLQFYFTGTNGNGLLTLKLANTSNVTSSVSYNLGATIQRNVWYKVGYSIQPTGADLAVKLYLSEKDLPCSTPVLCKTLTGFTYNTGTGAVVIGENNHTGNSTFTGAIDEVIFRKTAF